MITYNKETPILLLAQGRIETVRQIYNMLRQIEPNRLYLYYDTLESEDEKNRHEQIRALFEKTECRCLLQGNRNNSIVVQLGWHIQQNLSVRRQILC